MARIEIYQKKETSSLVDLTTDITAACGLTGSYIIFETQSFIVRVRLSTGEALPLARKIVPRPSVRSGNQPGKGA